MKKAIIEEVSNGIVITIIKAGNQSLVDNTSIYVANDLDEALTIVRKNA